MRIRPLALTMMLCAGALLGAAGGLRSTLLFQGTFDLSQQAPKAEVGQFQFKGGGAMQLVPAGGGFVAQIGGSVQDATLAAWFVDGKAVGSGHLEFDASIVSKTKGAYEICLITDEPTSAFYPASGSSGDGGLSICGVPTGANLPVNVSVHYRIELDRLTILSNWNYTVTVSWPDASKPGGETLVVAGGTLPNSALRKIIGLAFVKPAGSNAMIQIDDVQVSHTGV